MRINNNLIAMNTTRTLGINVNDTSKAMEKLSSGQRINKAADDAAGLSISEKCVAKFEAYPWPQKTHKMPYRSFKQQMGHWQKSMK